MPGMTILTILRLRMIVEIVVPGTNATPPTSRFVFFGSIADAAFEVGEGQGGVGPALRDLLLEELKVLRLIVWRQPAQVVYLGVAEIPIARDDLYEESVGVHRIPRGVAQFCACPLADDLTRR